MEPIAAGTFAVEARELARDYAMGSSRVCAVAGVSFEIAGGDFVALLGPSGSGKSTLLNLIAGLDRATAGSISVFGRELSQLSSTQMAAYRRDTVGMVFQSFQLIPSMTLEQNVELPMRFAEVERGERRERIENALQRVGIAHRRRHRPGELSGGEQQRCAIARALVNRPKILLADEPTGNLDSKTGEEIMELLRELNQTLATTVVMVTHERALAERFVKRMIFLADGRIVSSQPANVTEAAR